MYIYLGGEKIICFFELVVIFDILIEKFFKIFKQYVMYVEQEKIVECIGEEEVKFIVVIKNIVYYLFIFLVMFKKWVYIFFDFQSFKSRVQYVFCCLFLVWIIC